MRRWDSQIKHLDKYILEVQIGRQGPPALGVSVWMWLKPPILWFLRVQILLTNLFKFSTTDWAQSLIATEIWSHTGFWKFGKFREGLESYGSNPIIHLTDSSHIAEALPPQAPLPSIGPSHCVPAPSHWPKIGPDRFLPARKPATLAKLLQGSLEIGVNKHFSFLKMESLAWPWSFLWPFLFL